MQKIEDLFSFNGRKVWMRDAGTGELLPDNPFFVKEDCILDARKAVRDDIIGLFFRGRITATPEEFPSLQEDEEYTFLSYPGLKEKKRKYTGAGLDYLNLLVGNVFRTSTVSSADRARVRSIFDALSRLKKPVMASIVQDADLFLKRLKEADAEQAEIPPVDPDFPEDTKDRGILKKIAETAT